MPALRRQKARPAGAETTPHGGGPHRTPHAMKETPSSPGGKGGRAGDYSLLKENQTRFRKKKGHSGQRGGKRGVKTEDQSRALSDHGAHVAPDAQKWLSD